MADTRLPAITNEETTLADGDLFYVVDISDTSEHASGSSAKIQASNLYAAVLLAPTLGGTLNANAKSIENLGAVEEQVNTVATSGATETLDTSLYGVHDITMDQACTFTFSNPAPSGDMASFVLILRGAFTPTLPASVDWSGGAAPTYTTPSVYTFVTVDAGTTWLGAQSGAAFA